MRRKWMVGAAMVAVSSMLLAPGAYAHDSEIEADGYIDGHAQHNDPTGHLPATSANVRLVSKLELSNVEEGTVADVGVWRDHAYLARFRPDVTRCFITEGLGNGGVWIVNIKDPSKPREVAFIPTDPGSYVGEGVQTISVKTRHFKGDILFFNNETCALGTQGGLSMYDVSDPANPQPLALHFGDTTTNGEPDPGGFAHQIHSAFAWQGRDDRLYVAIVDDDEAADIDIVDASDPRNPVLIAEYELDTFFPQILQPELGTAETFFHDMIVKKIKGRYVMSASYWDGGYVLMDVTDPLAPTYIADSDFGNPDALLQERTGLTELPEGNAHQSEFTRDNRYLIAADEDFSPINSEVKNTATGATLNAGTGSDTPAPAPGDDPIVGPTKYVGLACTAASVPAGDGTQIAVVERGGCTFNEKVAAVEGAGGYIAVVIFNRQLPDACNGAGGMSVEGNLPTFGVMPRSQGFELFGATFDLAACEAATQPTPFAVGTVGAPMSIRSFFDGWGYVRLFRNGEGKLTELDQYAIPEAHDLALAEGFGDLSVHEVAVSERKDDLAYLSYYAGGFRVIRIERNKIVETGHFIDEGGNNLWGVQVFSHRGRELVAASDRDFGLYIFEYTGRR